MLINENRLSMVDPEARRFLNEELQKFFFGEGSTKPKEYIPSRISINLSIENFSIEYSQSMAR